MANRPDAIPFRGHETPARLPGDEDKPIAWVTGARGLIGHYLVEAAPEFGRAWRVKGLTRADLDLTDFSAVERRFKSDSPRLIIHCAALSRSPDCQKDPPLAWKLNRDVTKHLAELAADIPFVFFSSDLVFDGRKGNYDESEQPNPLSVYAETKIAAEQMVLSNRKHTVVRTSLNGGTSPASNRAFNEELRLAWQSGQPSRLFVDEFRSPLPAVVTARAVWEFAASGRPGLYHLAGRERLSRWEIGQLIAARWPQLNPKLVPTSIKEYAGAPRPEDTSLNCGKIQKLLSFQLPGLKEWLEANPHEAF